MSYIDIDEMKPRILAFYLPQYYPCSENDEWWGRGFTEWTNVGKAKPLFNGHDQPRVPADLGYYDLRLPEVREQQAELAKEAGVTAFCYWHYWFGNGKRLLDRVFDEVLSTGHPDFPFCLGWANHSWYAKNWNKDEPDRLLIEQTYPGYEDAKMHFDFLIKAFKDPRYVKIDGMPFLFIFRPKELPQCYLQWFHEWTKQAGFKDIYLVANVGDDREDNNNYKQIGYNAVLYNRMPNVLYDRYRRIGKCREMYERVIRLTKQLFTGMPKGAMDYKKYYPEFIQPIDYDIDVIPELIPQWDHSPRSSSRASSIYYNSKPEFFYNHAKDALKAIKDKPEEYQILILKSWNEWGEGNYMEPDLTNGKGFIKALHKAIDDFDVKG